MEEQKEAVVYGSDVDELQRKEDTEQIKKLAEEVFKTMLAAAVKPSNYSLWQEAVFDIVTPYKYATRDGELETFHVEYALSEREGFSPVAIRAAYALPSTSTTYGTGYFFGVYMYGYIARIFYGTDSSKGSRLSVRLIVTYIRNTLNVPTITIPQ